MKSRVLFYLLDISLWFNLNKADPCIIIEAYLGYVIIYFSTTSSKTMFKAY